MIRALKRLLPVPLKKQIRAVIFIVTTLVARLPITDERKESSELKRAGMLNLGSEDISLLSSPMPRSGLLESDDTVLDSARWFLYQFDAPLRRGDITSYDLDDVPYWDSILGNHFRPFELHWLVKLLRSRTEIGGDCLEIGCGVRSPTPYLLAKYYNHVTAIDLDPAISWNEQRDNLNFEVVDATHLPYPDGYFDDVYSVSVIEHFKLGTAAGACKEAYRVLKDGGRFAITVDIGEERKGWPGWHHKDDIYGNRDTAFWVGLLRNIGFEVHLDPYCQGRYNDWARLLRVCVAGSGDVRRYAAYRIVAQKIQLGRDTN